MSIRSKFKKAVTGIISTAMVASSVTTMSYSPSVNAATDNNYYEALAMSLYFYDSNACGTGITDGPLTWRGDCHTYDATASVGTLSGSAKAIVDPDGDGKVDVSGGFHDAGDHIKFNLTIGFGISSLAMSDYLFPGVYEKAGCKDHLMYELKWGADYLMKTTFLDGSDNVAAVAHVVAEGGTDHSYWSAPETQTYARPVYWLTSSSNNSAVCCEMAAGLAGTAYVWRDADPAYADECIRYAKALLSFGQKHVGNNSGGIGGFYDTDAQYQDEEALAQAWLWILNEGDKPSRTPKSGDYGGNQYDGYVYTWDKVWQGYCSMMYKATGENVFKQELIYEYPNQGGISETTYCASGWGASRYNCAKQLRGLILAEGDANSSYAKAAKFQMDHILGNNSLGYSFLIGYGNKWPVHIHHRAANPGNGNDTASTNPSAKYTNYGMLVGGDDNSGYQDQTDKYQYTEGALDYNGCFALACAGLADLYGGDASAIKSIESSASEINNNFVFGNSEPDDPTISKTTTTRITTTKASTTTVVTTKVTEKVNVAAGKELNIELKGADELEFIIKSDAGDNGNGAISYTSNSGQYSQTGQFNFTDDGSGKTVINTPVSGIEAQNDTVTLHLWWSNKGSSTISEVYRVYYKVVDTPIQTTTTTTPPENIIWGDSNDSGEVKMNDAVLIMQMLANDDAFGLTGTDENHITEKGYRNADVYEHGTSGVTNMDAVWIQKYLIHAIPTLNPILDATSK